MTETTPFSKGKKKGSVEKKKVGLGVTEEERSEVERLDLPWKAVRQAKEKLRQSLKKRRSRKGGKEVAKRGGTGGGWGESGITHTVPCDSREKGWIQAWKTRKREDYDERKGNREGLS